MELSNITTTIVGMLRVAGPRARIMLFVLMYALVCVLFCIFSFAADDSLSGSPALDATGTVYIGDWGGTLYAVNGSSGVLLWRYRKALGAFKGSPAITANGTIVIGSLDGAVYGIAGALGLSVCHGRLTFSLACLLRQNRPLNSWKSFYVPLDYLSTVVRIRPLGVLAPQLLRSQRGHWARCRLWRGGHCRVRCDTTKAKTCCCGGGCK